MDCKIIFGFILGIIGTFFGTFIAHLFSEQRRIKEGFNKAAESFSNDIIPTINKLKLGGGHDVSQWEFTSHREAMLCFIQHLSGEAWRSFEKDWNEYENWYQDVCCRGTEGRLFPDEGEVEFGKKRAINPSTFLNKLLIHAAPK